MTTQKQAISEVKPPRQKISSLVETVTEAATFDPDKLKALKEKIDRAFDGRKGTAPSVDLSILVDAICALSTAMTELKCSIDRANEIRESKPDQSGTRRK